VAECSPIIANPRSKRAYRSIFRSGDTVRKRAGLADGSMQDLRGMLVYRDAGRTLCARP